MSITSDHKVEVFREELDLIQDLSVREFTELCLIASPDYVFQDCPASSSGKFHHVDELSWDGTIIHTKKVVSAGFDLARGMGLIDKQDEVIAACIIHDLRKQGKKKTGYTQKNHPHLAAELVAEVHYDTNIIDDTVFNSIRTACGYHYGPWSARPWKKPMEHYTLVEMATYLADYVASRLAIKVNYKTRAWDKT